MGIKNKSLLFLFFIGLFSVALISSVLYFITQNKEVDIVNSLQMSDMRNLGVSIENEIEYYFLMTRSQILSPVIPMALEQNRDLTLDPSVSSFLENQKRLMGDVVDSISLLDSSGHVLYSTGEMIERDCSGFSWWEALTTSSEQTGYLKKNPFPGRPYMLGILTPIFLDTRFKGVLLCDIRVSRILEKCLPPPSPGRSITLVSLDGSALGISREYRQSFPVPENLQKTVLDNLDSTYFDKERNAYITSVELDPLKRGEPWILMEHYDRAMAHNMFHTGFRNIPLALFVILFVLLLFLLGAQFFIIQPIGRITRDLNKIGDSNLSLRIQKMKAGELGELAQAVNAMLDRISHSTASKDEVEQAVQSRETERLNFENLINTMPEGFASHEIILDATGHPVDYRFLSINPSFEKIIGLKASEVVGKRVLELFPNTESYWIEKYGQVALTGVPIHFENFAAEQGRHFSATAFSPSPGRFAVSFFDITHRINAEKALEKEKEFLSITLRSIGDGVIATDEKGDILFINAVTEQLTGWNNQEALGKPLEEVFCIVNEYSHDRCENPALKVIESGEMTDMANHICLLSKDGNRYIIENSASPIKDRTGQLLGVIIVFRDATDKIQIRERLNQSQKLNALGLLAGGIAHDFNNYLAGLMGYVELSINSLKTGKIEKSSNYLSEIMNVSEKAKSLTNQLLTFSKGGKPHRNIADLTTTITTSVQFALRGSRVVSEIDVSDDLWNCNCDINQIAQCIDNIVLNAVQSMHDGGILKVSAKNETELPGHPGDSSYLCIRITDSGEGIPLHIRDKIFDPFFTTKEKGHGLGLSTVFSIIKHHEGWIDIQSEEGRGSTFSLYLPAEKSQVVKNRSDSRKDHGKEGIILILDDQEYILEILKVMLEEMGYSVIQVSRGDQVVDRISESMTSGQNIMACILDLTLPGDLNGEEIAGRVRALSSEMILIASSGYADSPVMSDPSAYGFNASLSKPYTFQELSEVLADQLKTF